MRPEGLDVLVEPLEASRASQQDCMPKTLARPPDRSTFAFGNETACLELRRRAGEAHSQTPGLLARWYVAGRNRGADDA